MAKVVFICSPLRGNEEINQELCRKYCKFACDQGYVPFAPHIFYTQFLLEETEEERNRGISCGLEILKRCDEIWVFAKDEQSASEGMKTEIEFAKQHDIIIKYCNIM